VVRVPAEVASRLRSGHPWVYREALGGRPMREAAGDSVEVLDPDGTSIGRGLYDPHGAIAVRLYARDKGPELKALLPARVDAAVRLREALLPGVGSGLTAYRVLHSEGDGVPGITVDRYGDYLVTHLFTPVALAYRDALYDALEQRLHPAAIYEQRRFRPINAEDSGSRGPAELARGSVAPVELQVAEGDAKFYVDVTAPLSPGLFPDLRAGRERVRQVASGRRVLNLFSYTGALSLYAALGGATEIVSVDLAQKAHARARRNFTASGVDPDKHEWLAGDAFKVMARFEERGRRFDLVILDPPSFSQSKEGRAFSAAKDYAELCRACLSVLAPGGLLFASSATQRLDAPDLDRAIGEAAVAAGQDLRVVDRLGLPPDFPTPAGFPEGAYLKALLAVRASGA
jgi:23S rRNA (cytosine1962-C5)-methyltransferase